MSHPVVPPPMGVGGTKETLAIRDLSPEQVDLPRLRQAITDKFSQEELRTLAYDLRLDREIPETLALTGQARELVAASERAGRLGQLLEHAASHRPDFNWFALIRSTVETDAPFKGLEFFDEADAQLFFGREALTAALVSHLRQHRFLAVLGASGSGKSSLVRAGLVPALKAGQALADGTEPLAGSANWRIHILTPTSRPLEALAEPLTRDVESLTAFESLIDDLAGSRRSLHLAAQRIIKRSDHEHMLLIVDQFEELFTHCRDEERRRAFIDNLLTAANSGSDGPTSVVLTLRADFYHRCAQYDELRDALERQQKYIGRMSTDELRRAIENPARRHGLHFEEGLVDLLLHDAGDEPGALPLLSHALLETWRRRQGSTLTFAGYQAAGGVRGAIAQTAETVFRKTLSAEEQVIAKNIFLRLIEPGEGSEDTRRRARLVELIPRPTEAPAVQAVLKRLADARLVTTQMDSADVAHEALIREWSTLQGWLDENREGVRLRRQLTEAARDWQDLDQDPGALWRGARLAQAREWATEHDEQLNELERAFLARSQAAVEALEQEKEAARQRELAQARALAEEAEGRRQAEAERAREAAARAREQGEAAARSRRQVIGLAILLGVAILLASAAAIFGARANENERQAQANADLAATKEAEALTREAQATAALGREAEALAIARTKEAEAVAAADAEATARARSEESEARAQEQAQIALARKLAAEAISVIEREDDTELAILLSVEAVRTMANTSLTNDEQASEALQRALQAAPIAIHRHPDLIQELVYSPDGSKVASASQDGQVQLIDTESGAIRTQLAHDGRVNVLAFSPDGHLLVTGGQDGNVHIIGNDLAATIPHDGPVNALAFTPDGSVLVTAGDDGVARVVNVELAESTEELEHGYPLLGVVFGPNGNRLAVMGDSGQAQLWNAQTWTPVATLPHGARVRTIIFNADGSRLASRSEDFSARLWDAASGENLAIVQHADWVTEIHFNPDGRRLASASQDGTAVLISTDTGEQLGILPHDDMVASMAFNGDGSRLATASRDGQVRLWDTTSGEIVRSYPHKGEVWRVSFSPDETQLAAAVAMTAELSSETHIWDVATGVSLLVLRSISTTGVLDLGRIEDGVFTTFLADAEYTADGKHLVTRRLDGFVQIWDVPTRTLQRVLSHGESISEFVLHPQGTQVATAGRDMTVRLWPMEMGERDGDTEEDVGALLSRACSIASRNLSSSEWELYVGDAEYRPTCPGLPSER